VPLTTVQAGMLDTTAQYYSFKSSIINGAMVIDQRNAGASVTPTNAQYLVDRFFASLTQASKFTATTFYHHSNWFYQFVIDHIIISVFSINWRYVFNSAIHRGL
jgi:hypothetical protein